MEFEHHAQNDTLPIARVVCPDCGDLEVTTKDMTILTYSQKEHPSYSYLFTCPECAESTLKSATPRIAQLLQAIGVVSITLPDQKEERDTPLPPITPDDILSFHNDLLKSENPGIDF